MQHFSDFGCLAVQHRHLRLIEVAKALYQFQLRFQLSGRAQCDGQEAEELSGGPARVPFRDVRGDRNCAPSDLCPETEQLVLGKTN